MRDLAILRRRADSKELHGDGTEAFVARFGSGVAEKAVLDLPHPAEAARARFAGRFPIRLDALAWLPRGAALPAAWASTFEEAFRYTVSTEVGWPAPSDDPATPEDVVKQVSFLHGASGYALDSFRAHYRDHVAVARKYMPALWQYVQNDVEAAHGEAPETRGVLAVSELWFRTTDDFLNRYFPSEADQRAFSAHEDFLDLRQATSFVCASARPPDAEAGR